IGLHAIIQTIMIGKMEIVFPAMYMINRFMGICLSGPKAMSQHRCKRKQMYTYTLLFRYI
uniref:Rho GTPase-activating protein 26 n=1 Tax=Xenopus tropicalis TaxID=8364 RepID=A0A5S6K3B0_XENTR